MKRREFLFIFFIIIVSLLTINCASIKSPAFIAHFSKETFIKQRLAEFFAEPDFQNAFWGVCVEDAATGKCLFSLNAEKNFVPASNLKLYTTAVALLLLGPDFRYETKIYYQGEVDPDGILQGDLIIKGSGDPSISDRYRKDSTLDKILSEWVTAVQQAGIKRINGDIIGDDDCFDDQEIAGTWENDDLPFWYATGSSGLAIADNCYTYEVRPGSEIGARAKIKISPPSDYVTIINDVLTTAGEGRSSVEVWREPNTNLVRIYGTVSIKAGEPIKHFASIHNGTLYTLHLFADRLKQSGIEFTGQLKDIDDIPAKSSRVQPQLWKLIHTHYSPPLSELIKIVN
ncbi:MAG: D-alanyl-D-alanine carboxypeptidase/D-alanyl-D-alanine-endopeptidase, partial [Candidatus Sumerlaeia bacterium]|nr:D-alanyl-D-alanine carboxypeptidase/D-alanyl-D-alanine-endopeptidase [Candidatus Sumerlaeia bacterium]